MGRTDPAQPRDRLRDYGILDEYYAANGLLNNEAALAPANVIVHRQVPSGIGRHNSAQLPSWQVDPYCGTRRLPPHITGLAHQCFWGHDDDHRDDQRSGHIQDRRWFTQLEHSVLADVMWRSCGGVFEGNHEFSIEWCEGEQRRLSATLATVLPQTPTDDTAVSRQGGRRDAIVTPDVSYIGTPPDASMIPQTSLPNQQMLPELTPAPRANQWPHWLEPWPTAVFRNELKAPSKANHPVGCWDPHVIDHDSMLPDAFRISGQAPAPTEPRKWAHCLRQLNTITPLNWSITWPRGQDNRHSGIVPG